RCLLTVGRSVAFPRPQGGAAATVDYSLEFQSSGQTSVIDLPEGALDPELPALFAQLGSACERVDTEEVLATFYVDPAGRVRSAGLASTLPLDPAAAECLSSALDHARLGPGAFRGPGVGRVTVAV